MNAAATPPPDPEAMQIADRILAGLTLEEKVRLCHGSGTMTLGTIPRVGIDREFQMSDNSSTIRPDLERFSWAGNDKTATAFPSMSALGATWDRSLAHQFGNALGREARARDKDMLLGPGVNIHRTPLCGRNWEYPSEDPVLTSKLVVPYIRGVQKNDVAATIKHFALNSQELERHHYDAAPDERTLREIYLPAFEAAVKEAGVLAVMNAYNRFRGEYCSHSSYLNNTILKGEWGFQGLVVTDWGSLHDTVQGALGGTDIEMNHGQHITHFKQPLLKAVKSGAVSESVLDDKVRRILFVMARTSFIGDSAGRQKGALETPGHRNLARGIAEQSITLLKNDGPVLPLDPATTRKLLVVGNNAVALHCPGGGSATANPKHEVSPLEGIRSLLGRNTRIRFHDLKTDGAVIKPIPESWIKTLDPGSTRVGLGQPAFKAQYFANPDLDGSPAASRYDHTIDFNWNHDALPDGLPNENFSARWTADITPLKSGRFALAATVDDGVRVLIDDQVVLSSWQPGAERIVRGAARLTKGVTHRLTVEYMQLGGDAICRFGLEEHSMEDLDTLASSAKVADAVIVFTGNNHDGPGNVETEGQDRSSMDLLPNDNAAIETALSANPRTIVVNLGGAAVEMPWISRAPAVLQYFFSGQEGGHAIANVLFGRANPGGKLPFTMPVRLQDSPAHAMNDYHPDKIRYSEGVFVGYRWFDARQVAPLFPFGHGLSYTSFELSPPALSASTINSRGTLDVEVRVTNTGDRAGSEVVQLYLAPPDADVPRPPRELKDFAKVRLQPGESQLVTMQLDRRDLSYWDVDTNGWMAVPGSYQIEIGTSSRDIRHRASFDYRP